MAKCALTIKFNTNEFNRILRLAEENVFIVMQGEFTELDSILNNSGISDSEDLVDQ